MAWFKRRNEGITTGTHEKLEAPDGVWYKCPDCKSAIPMVDLSDNLHVCPKCDHHARISAKDYFRILFDENEYTELFPKMVAEDILANPDLVATKYPLMSAAFFFNSNGLWSICDKGADDATVTAVTKRVNGGTIGLPDRIKHFKEYYSLLA